MQPHVEREKEESEKNLIKRFINEAKVALIEGREKTNKERTIEGMYASVFALLQFEEERKKERKVLQTQNLIAWKKSSEKWLNKTSKKERKKERKKK